MTNAEAKRLAETVTDTMLDTVERLLKQGHDQKALWEATRDCLVERFGFSPLAAANTTRLMIAATAKRLGLPAPYSDQDLATIHQIACAN